MINKFKPFWSLDILKTERWLSDLATRGYRLVKLNFNTSTFLFESSEPGKIIYSIVYEQGEAGALPRALLNDGWHQVFRGRKWYIAANEKNIDSVITFPARDGLFRRNRTLLLILAGTLLFLLGLRLVGLFLLLLIMSLTGFWSFPVSPVDLIIICLAYFCFKLIIANKELYHQPAVIQREESEEVPLPGKQIVKRRFYWHFEPDRLEQWLERMETQGYHLHHVNKLGICFFFIRDVSRRVKILC